MNRRCVCIAEDRYLERRIFHHPTDAFPSWCNNTSHAWHHLNSAIRLKADESRMIAYLCWWRRRTTHKESWNEQGRTDKVTFTIRLFDHADLQEKFHCCCCLAMIWFLTWLVSNRVRLLSVDIKALDEKWDLRSSISVLLYFSQFRTSGCPLARKLIWKDNACKPCHFTSCLVRVSNDFFRRIELLE